jgi:1,4-alpha-glucan branching enzyme
MAPSTASGYLAIVLHAHLPFVRNLENDRSLEERWLHEAITESYIPLFLVLEQLLEDGIDFRLTFSVSPPLAAMLNDPLLQTRYVEALERLIELAEKEGRRTRRHPEFHSMARIYHALFLRAHDAFVNRYRRNLLNAFRRFAATGKVDLMTTAATHGYLPLLSMNESAVRAQVRVGVEHHCRLFGRKPKGFWLPECGYYPGVDALLREQDVWFTILETHGITRATSRPHYGVYAPVYTPSGVAAFGRDPDSSRQVWSSNEGYPGDPDYREFYRDIGHDLDLEYLRPYILPDGVRVDTGIKYYRVTGDGKTKEPYVPEWARAKAEGHAEHFLTERREQVARLSAFMDRTPIVVAPYDAELFGHWWFEGPIFLDHLIRKAAAGHHGIRMATLPDYLAEFPVNQASEPTMSSWGSKGFNEAWLNSSNDWIYPHLQAAAEMMETLWRSHGVANGATSRALDQAARELLLAQASDWAFMISGGGMRTYATSRVETHLRAFHQLRREIEVGRFDEGRLAGLEARDNIFEDMRVAEAFDNRSRNLPPQPVQPGRPPRLAKTEAKALHIAMICPEIAPFAKTGGLADMVSSLALALGRLGPHVTLIMPAYRDLLSKGHWPDEQHALAAKLGDRAYVYFIRADRYFNRENLYGGPEGDYPDNAARFSFFAHAALELLGRIPAPDIVQAHDWQAALAIALLKTQPERYPGLASVRTIFTIHNLGYQGLFSPTEWSVLGLDSGLFNPQCLEFYGKINFLKGGLVFADALTTVSPTYAREVQTSEHGFGLEGILKNRSADLSGILNGADYAVWNPADDSHIERNYTLENLYGKSACKADLQAVFGLDPDPDVPLIGVVSRLVYQKGFDIVQAALDSLLQRNVQFVLLGTGEKPYEDFFAGAAKRYPGKTGVRIGYGEALAHKIVAGADMFLMPSRYEPSGLTQLYSLKYGTIPIVRATGGLKDSVEDFNPETGEGTGFQFEALQASALLEAVDRALRAFRNKEQWAALMRNGMTADFSWDRPAHEYLALYQRLVER